MLIRILALLFVCLVPTVRAENHLDPVGDDEIFFSIGSLYCAEGYAVEQLAGNPVYFSKFYIKWGASDSFAKTGMESVPDGSGGTTEVPVVIFYPSAWYDNFPELDFIMMSASDDVTWAFTCALLSLSMYHEMLHHCYGLDDEDAKARYSCEHAKIAFATFQAGCQQVSNLSAVIQDLKEDIQEEPDPVKREALELELLKREMEQYAICLKLEQIAAKWNGFDDENGKHDPGQAPAVAACLNGEGAEGGEVPSGCPDGYPPLPVPPAATESGYPGDIVFAPCADCAEYEL